MTPSQLRLLGRTISGSGAVAGHAHVVEILPAPPSNTILDPSLVGAELTRFDAAVARAIDAASPLPVPDDPKLFQRYFRKFNLSFRPKE